MPLYRISSTLLVTRAVTLFAGQLNVGKKLHFDGDSAVAVADIAAAARNVEREVSGRVATPLCLGLRRKELANRVEGLDIGHRIRARRAPDRGLIDQDNIVQPLGALDSR